jgi:hypothetical protein
LYPELVWLLYESGWGDSGSNQATKLVRKRADNSKEAIPELIDSFTNRFAELDQIQNFVIEKLSGD